ncbi:4-diphosphocytidyl-2C-methyl-D-erythritol synthase [Tolypothrix sp. NIES-4075]|uniref:nucleotidyltransferase family protein n=1 Tax=Tolypothrix sp. NIES-4075 TaxID=2005459 RepID=UPI000B5CD280|nr:nucleotidyltransferase family protein [Tolypothrix sp. NIES-4075]GAX40591.1 4-diphosphocytidyl-2C-methyl-D-erythritol synthase [Tolypothrix sp. NIES-4075]
MTNPTIGIIILAAGASTRMGKPKQLLPYQGRSLLRHITEVAIASKNQPVIVVLGANAEIIKPEICQLPVQIVENLQWASGMSSSIQAGVNALGQNVEAVAIALCDQPFVSVQVINQLVEAYRLTNKAIVACEYANTLGVPALFHHSFFSELMTLKQGEGAKQIIKKYINQVTSIPFLQGKIDIDTPDDYEQLQIM